MSNHTISGGQKQVTLFKIHGVHYMKSRCIGNKVSGRKENTYLNVFNHVQKYNFHQQIRRSIKG